MRGYAPTGPAPSGDYSIASLAADVDAVLAALGATDAIVVGHDWGAAAALAAATSPTARFSRLVAISVPPLGRIARSWIISPTQRYRSRYMLAMQLPGAAGRLRADNFAWVKRLWIEWSPSLNPPDELLESVRESLRPEGCAEAAVAYYRALAGRSTGAANYLASARAAFSKVRVPTLAISGGQDGCIGADVFDGLVDDLPEGSEVVELPTAGHFVPVEAPAAIAALIHRFATQP
jgi:pimeloyl-ACP methyl ester carboxylesterase